MISVKNCRVLANDYVFYAIIICKIINSKFQNNNKYSKQSRSYKYIATLFDRDNHQ